MSTPDYHACSHNWVANGIVRTRNTYQGTWTESDTQRCTICGLKRHIGKRRENNWSGD